MQKLLIIIAVAAVATCGCCSFDREAYNERQLRQALERIEEDTAMSPMQKDAFKSKVRRMYGHTDLPDHDTDATTSDTDRAAPTRSPSR